MASAGKMRQFRESPCYVVAKQMAVLAHNARLGADKKMTCKGRPIQPDFLVIAGASVADLKAWAEILYAKAADDAGLIRWREKHPPVWTKAVAAKQGDSHRGE